MTTKSSVVIGPSSRELGIKIANLLGAEKIFVQRKKFPDGESYIRLEKKPSNSRVIIVQTLYPQNDSVVELKLMLDTLIEFKPFDVSLVIPYFAYQRQHKRYRTWEAISAKVIAEMFDHKHVDRVLIADVHDRILLKFFKNAETHEISAAELIAGHFAKLRNPFVLVPDQERGYFAKIIAEKLGCEYSWLSKHRDRVTGNITTKIRRKFNVSGKYVILVDDVISSGKTMLNAIALVKKLGAKSVSCAASHYVPLGAEKMLKKAGAREVIASNSIPSSIGKLDLAEEIADTLNFVI